MAELDLRSDLVIVFKEGGDAELQIKNATRAVVGGVLTNIGDGLLAFVMPAAGSGNLDAVLALGGSLTADRASDMATFKWTIDDPHIVYDNADSSGDPIIEFNSAVQGLEIIHVNTNSSNNTAPWQVIITADPGSPDDNTALMGWNIDSSFDAGSPSWTTRLEYKYLGSLYEYHLQWSSLTGPRTYRLMSHTFHDTGSAATDTNLLFVSATEFRVRDFATNNDYFVVTSSGSGTTFAVVDVTGNSGISIALPPSGSSVVVSPSGAGSLNWIYSTSWVNVYFGNTLHWVAAKPTFLNGLAGTDANAFEINSAGGASSIVMRTSGTASVIQNETFNMSYYAANNSGGHFFWTANATALADFQLDVNGNSHLWSSLKITNTSGSGSDLLVRTDVATKNASVRLLLPDTDLGVQLYTLNSGYVTNGIFVARSGVIISTAVQGLAIAANDAAGTIRFASGSLTECARFDANGKLTFTGSTATRAPLNIGSGTVASSPVDGDVYSDNTHAYIRIAGAWKQIDN